MHALVFNGIYFTNLSLVKMRSKEVRIASRETIKPYSPEVHLLKPFKLSFLDQLTPPMYVPHIFFYSQNQISDSNSNSSQISTQLKTSLSKTLNYFYPLSGRPRDNLCVDSYEEGVPYIDARLNCCLSDYLQHVEIEELNQLLPSKPYCCLPDPTTPLLAVQLNAFDCGGIALSVCTSHKIFDASTVSAFFRSWSAFSRGSDGKLPRPDLLTASSQLFPPRDRMPENTLSQLKSIWLNSQGRQKTRTFVFDAKSVDTLKSKVRSKSLEHPTRVQALTAFIWKYAMLASRSASGISKPSVCIHAVNIRKRMEPQLPDYSIGNMFWYAFSLYNSDKNDTELQELAYLVKEGLHKDYLDGEQSGEGAKFTSEKLTDVLAKFALEGDIEIYGFSSLLNSFGFHDIDFGWGEPSLHSTPGVVGRDTTSNLIMFKEIGQHKEIEAWITLEEKQMAILENDPEFLAFASPKSLLLQK